MTDKEKEFLKSLDVREVIEAIGVDEILEKVPVSDILSNYELDDILDGCSFPTEIADFLKDNGFDFNEFLGKDTSSEDEEEDDGYMSDEELLVEFCRRYKPRGVLTKDDMKEIINSHIDDMVNKCF